jgi:hypothetical protein
MVKSCRDVATNPILTAKPNGVAACLDTICRLPSLSDLGAEKLCRRALTFCDASANASYDEMLEGVAMRVGEPGRGLLAPASGFDG